MLVVLLVAAMLMVLVVEEVLLLGLLFDLLNDLLDRDAAAAVGLRHAAVNHDALNRRETRRYRSICR